MLSITLDVHIYECKVFGVWYVINEHSHFTALGNLTLTVYARQSCCKLIEMYKQVIKLNGVAGWLDSQT